MGNCTLWCTHKIEPMARPREPSVVATDLSYSLDERQLIQLYLPDFDGRLKTTAKQQELTANHWSIIFQDLDLTSSVDDQSSSRHVIAKLYRVFYSYIYKHHPELRSMFWSSSVSRSSVLANLTAGLYAILYTPSHLLSEHIQRITATHSQWNVKPEHFNAMGRALLRAIAEVSGPVHWRPDVEEAWKTLYCQYSVLLLAQQITLLQSNESGRKETEHQLRGASEATDSTRSGPDKTDFFNVDQFVALAE